MRPACLLLIALYLALGGCAAHRVTLTQQSDFSEVNADLAGREARLVMKDGRETTATEITIERGTTSWRNVSDWQRVSVPTADIYFIKVRKRARGALKGLLYGGGGGLAMATGMYWSDPDEPYQSVVFLFVPVLATLFGVPAGLITDADVYEIDFGPPAPGLPADRGEGH